MGEQRQNESFDFCINTATHNLISYHFNSTRLPDQFNKSSAKMMKNGSTIALFLVVIGITVINLVSTNPIDALQSGGEVDNLLYAGTKGGKGQMPMGGMGGQQTDDGQTDDQQTDDGQTDDQQTDDMGGQGQTDDDGQMGQEMGGDDGQQGMDQMPMGGTKGGKGSLRA